MYELKDFQKKAKSDFDKTVRYLQYKEVMKELRDAPHDPEVQNEAMNGRLGQNPFRIKIDAPTGSGKTVLMGSIMNDFFKDYTMFWFSPGAGELEEQSAARLRVMMGDGAVERMDSATFNMLPATGACYVGNWEQFVSRDKATGLYTNKPVREGDSKNFFDMVAKIGSAYTPVAVIIDEAHYGSKKNTGAIRDFLKDIEKTLGYSPLYVLLSATHIIDASQTVKIQQSDVVGEGLMRKAVRLNTPELMEHANELSDPERNTAELERLMIDYSVNELAEELAEEYRRVDAHEIVKGKKHYIKPLVAIQVPVGKVGNDLVSRIENQLLMNTDADGNPDEISRANGQLAVFLSNDKTDNMKDIDRADSKARVLIYKQGVTTGWDCPRAQILVGFRHIVSQVFTKQNLGRFVRTAQAKHYGTVDRDSMLDYAYVISNVGDLGQTAFNENVSGYTMQETVGLKNFTKADGTSHRALASLEEAEVQTSYYRHREQTNVSLKTVPAILVEKANEMQLWERLEFESAETDYSGLVIGEDSLTDNKDEFEKRGESERIAKTADELAVLLRGVITQYIRDTGKTFRNDGQVARSMVAALTSWYKKALTSKPLPESLLAHAGIDQGVSLKAHYGKLSESAQAPGVFDWNQKIMEMFVHGTNHRSALHDLVVAIVEDERGKAEVADTSDGGWSSKENRERKETGSFVVPDQGFLVDADAEHSEISAGLQQFHALTKPVHQGVALSTPEKNFQENFLPQLVSGEHYSLLSFYKSPEGRGDSFRMAVENESSSHTFYPDWLLELQGENGVVIPAVVETKSAQEVAECRNDPAHITHVKAKALVELTKAHADKGVPVRAGLVYGVKLAGGEFDWRVISGCRDGELIDSPAKEFFTL